MTPRVEKSYRQLAFEKAIRMGKNGNLPPKEIAANNKNKRRAKNRVARAQRKRNR